jgi:hypothetical protein
LIKQIDDPNQSGQDNITVRPENGPWNKLGKDQHYESSQ